MAIEKIKITVSGRVQGVGFRYMTLLSAQKLNIFGQVWNKPDGSVGIRAQSDKPQLLSEFQNQLRMGFGNSRWIKVERVDIQPDKDAPDFTDFQITY